jgi:hypothetical protein
LHRRRSLCSLGDTRSWYWMRLTGNAIHWVVPVIPHVIGVVTETKVFGWKLFSYFTITSVWQF